MIIALILASSLWQTSVQIDSISLKQCYTLARQSQPIRKQLALNRKATKLSRVSINRKNYPQLSMSGNATYQNEVTSIPGAPFTISKDQYKLSLEVDQNLFDAETARKARKVNRAQGILNEAQTNVQLYSVHNEVNQAFFGVLLARTNKRVLELKKQVLVKRLAMIRSRVQNGMALPGARAALQAELLSTEQQITSVEADQEASLKTLSKIIGRLVNKGTTLRLPADTAGFIAMHQIDRPELKMYAANQQLLNRKMQQTKVTNLPRLSAFFQGMYGRPGLNIFKDQFEPNYMVGVHLRWNIWDWGVAKRRRSQLAVQKGIVRTQKQSFLRNVQIGIQRDITDISKYHRLLGKDRRIIELRKQVERQSASQLRNGTITPSNYLDDLNAVYQAQLSREQHHLQWIFAIIQYKTKTGTL